MNWRLKCRAFFIFQYIPFGKQLYYLSQKYITKNVWLNDRQFSSYYDLKVSKHLKYINEYGHCPVDEATIFEFGAGWDMFAPIGFAMNDVQRYTAVDLNSYAHPELVRNTVELYKRNFKSNNSEVCSKLNEYLNKSANSIDEVITLLKELFSVEYYAPMDAGNTNFESKSIDYVVSNVSLEHIPYKEIGKILKECNRLLKDGGLLSVTVDYSDHYAHSDSSISIFNYMKYSDLEWEKYNPLIHFQNRLKRSDYIELLKNNGFEIVSLYSVSSENTKGLRQIEMDEKFKQYPIEELLATYDHFLARKMI